MPGWGKDASFELGAREGLTGKVTFKQRPEEMKE